MKISNIKIMNFKGIESLEVKPARINILSGPNGMGKTSMLEGIRCAITGKTPDDYMAMGTSKSSVAVELEKLGTIERRYTPSKSKTLMCGKATTAKDVARDLGDILGCSGRTMNMMFSSELMEQMMGADLAEYLLNVGFLENDMDIEKLLSLCSLSKDAEDELRMLLPEAPEKITLGDIQEAYDMCFAARAERKKSLAEAEAAAKYAGPVPTRSVEDINTEQQSVSQQIGRLSAEFASYTKLKAAYDAHTKAMESLAEKLEAYKEVKAPPKTGQESVKKEIKDKRDVLQEVQSSIQVAEKDIAFMGKVLDALAKPVCPISNKLVCSTDKTGIRSELEDGVEQKEEIAACGRMKKARLEKELAELEKKREAIAKQERDYQSKLVYLEQYEKEQKVSLAEPVKPDLGLLTELQAREMELKNELNDATKYARAQEAEKRSVKLRKSTAIQQELVEQLSPKGGVRQKVLEYHIRPLQDYCNEKMQDVLPKYDMVLDTSDGFRVLFADKDSGGMINYKSLSKGEQLRAAYVLMSMFNALNQFRILMLDNLDGLDDASCQMLFGLIERDLDDYDHVFLASANESLERAAKASAVSGEAKIITF